MGLYRSKKKRKELGLTGAWFSEIQGRRYNQLIVLDLWERKNERIYWRCKCDCGAVVRVWQADLRARRVTSCGKRMCRYKALKVKMGRV